MHQFESGRRLSCRGGEIGRHKGLKIPRTFNVRAGSIPALGTHFYFMILNNLNIEQFLSVVIAHFLAVISPGPDFTLILKQSVKNGKKSALLTSLGISIGILIHVFYCIVGISYLISTNIYLYTIIKYVGAVYLLYLGFSSLRFKFINQKNNSLIYGFFENSLQNSFLMGFLTNIFNPKATLFFLSLFTFIIDSNTSLSIQVFYGLWMSLVTYIWFAFISIIITLDYFEKIIIKYSTIIDRLLGLVLIYISMKIFYF